MLRIEYDPVSNLGRVTVSADTPSYVWNRLKDAAIAAQPDALITNHTIQGEWATVLSMAPRIAELRGGYGFAVEYEAGALSLLTRFGQERRAVAAATGTLNLAIQEEDIQNQLGKLGFLKRELTAEQRRDACSMLSLPNGANFSVPGAGKTTVAFANYLLLRDEATYLLVVAPKNAFAAWDEVILECLESADSRSDMTPFVRLTGGNDSIQGLLRGEPSRMIISYDQLIRVIEPIALFMATHKVHVIVDESHRMKAGGRSQRGTVLLSLAHLAARRDILSGTPIPRSMDDITPQLDFLWPGQGLGVRVSRASSPHSVLHNLYVRTTKSELGLPSPHRHFVQVPMSDGQLALYGILRQEVLKRLAGISANANVDLMSAKRSVMRLLQASSNPIMVVRRLTQEEPASYRYDDPAIEAIFSAIVQEADSPKLVHACELARSLAIEGQKSIIWTSFTENVERLAALLADQGAVYIHGGVDTGLSEDDDTREGRIRLFHTDPGCRVLVANPAACSEGISLHRVCHHAIYVDRTFNAAHYLQSVDRIHRLGLDPNIETHIHVLESVAPSITGSIDYSVRRRLVRKLRIMSDALDDIDLQRLAIDEEDADQPVDYDITLEDLADVIDELSGKASRPEEEDC